MDNVTILGRVRSLCVGSPFYLNESHEPFDFDRVPTTKIDDCFRVTLTLNGTSAGLSYSEERAETLGIWVAKRTAAQTGETRETLHTLVNSLTAALVREGTVGDFVCTDDRSVEIDAPTGAGYVVGQVTQGITYMVEV